MKWENKQLFKRGVCALLTLVMTVSALPPVRAAETETPKLIGDIAVGKYDGFTPAQGDTSKPDTANPGFIKISHPWNLPSKMNTDPTAGETEEEKAANRTKHEKEVFADGLLDYAKNGVLAEPSPLMKRPDGDPIENGDRGQTYAWTGIAYGDWMYVSTQYNSAGETANLMGRPAQRANLDEMYGGDYWTEESDKGRPGSTLSKINVKTGEVKILMSASKNHLDAQFRSSIEFNDKLYFCGSVNHVPSIYEVNPINDALQCVYQDESMLTYPGGLGAAWKEAKDIRRICPAIRGLTAFDADGDGKTDHLVISCVGLDGNPYIAVSDDPSSGKFVKIAEAWEAESRKWVPGSGEGGKGGHFTMDGPTGELLGYPAFRIEDSIFGGSIWEMVSSGNRLYVAICTGTPENAPEKHKADIEVEDENGNKTTETREYIDTMQSFALIVGEYDAGKGDVSNRDAWSWAPLAGDQKDGAKFTFGLDKERTRAGACNLAIFNDYLYIGEYNDTQISFQNMTDQQFQFLDKNLQQSIAMYRVPLKDENLSVANLKDQSKPKPKIQKIMGENTKLFKNTVKGGSLSGRQNQFGFGQHTNQYVWQSKVFNGKLYIGTFDETMILRPLIKTVSENLPQQHQAMERALNDVTTQAEASVISEDAEEQELVTAILNDQKTYGLRNSTEDEWADYIASLGTNSYVPLPSAVFDAPAVVEVEDSFSLYQAYVAYFEMLGHQMNGTMSEKLIALVQRGKLEAEIAQYSAANEIPNLLQPAAQTLSTEASMTAAGGPDLDDNQQAIMDILEYTKDAVHGFDMYVTSDGVHFEQLTQRGLGGHYNQGLRAFAANDDPENKWMCIGSANPFYGTEIWRMEDHAGEGHLNKNIVDAPQVCVDVRFVDQLGRIVEGDRSDGKEIYVERDPETNKLAAVDPKGLNTILPGAAKIVDEETPITVDESEDKPFITVTLKDVAEKQVRVEFKEGATNVGTAFVSVPKNNAAVHRKDLEKDLPAGYVIATTEQKFKINKVTDAETHEVSYNAEVPVEKITYAITCASVKNGKVSVEQKAAPGAVVTITATPDQGYMVAENGVSVQEVGAEAQAVPVTAGENNTWTFTMPEKAVDVTVTFEAVKNTVTVMNGTGGGTFAYGTEVNVKANKAPEGQVFNKWTAEGVELTEEQAKQEELTFTMPDNAVTVTATYAYVITTAAAENGTVTAPKKAPAGETVTVTTKPAKGYSATGIVVTTADKKNVDVTAGEANTWTFTMPEAAVTVTASFDMITYDVTVVNGTGKGSFTSGTEVTVKANKAPKGQVFEKWTAEGVKLTEEQAKQEELTFTMPNNEVTVTATYAYVITCSKSQHGVVTAPQKAMPGETVIVTAKPNEGYRATGIIVKTADGKNVVVQAGGNNTWIFTMPEAAVKITANIAQITYNVTVENGTGKGFFVPGTEVTVKANKAPEGQVFDKWIAEGVKLSEEQAKQQELTFTMPDHAVKVTATYAYVITTDEGKNGTVIVPQKAVAGEAVTVTAKPEKGYSTAKVVVNTADGKSVAVTAGKADTWTFTMPEAAVKVTVEFALITYDVTVENGTGAGSFAPGREVTVKANEAPEGQVFEKWTAEGVKLSEEQAKKETLTFTMPNHAVKVTAVYKVITYDVTVENGTGAGNFAPGTEVTVKADKAAEGKVFDKWIAEGVKLSEEQAKKETMTFTMPKNAVKVTAVYKMITYDVTVENGTGAGNFAPGTEVTVKANKAPESQVFEKWTAEGVKLSEEQAKKETMTFTMPKNAVKVTAVYKVITYDVTVENGTGKGTFAPGTAVTVKADKAAEGKVFDKWIAEGVKLSAEQAKKETMTFTMPKNAVKLTATYADFVNPFIDVPADAHYLKPVIWAVQNDITSGISANEFGPDIICTRAQAVTFLWKQAGAPMPKNDKMVFKDVTSKDYYYNAVLWAVENGITKGTGETTFSPNMECTRAQIMTFIWQAAGHPEPKGTDMSFEDVKTNDYFYKAVLWAVENGITKGTGDMTFSPNMKCSRAQIVTFLYQYDHLEK